MLPRLGGLRPQNPSTFAIRAPPQPSPHEASAFLTRQGLALNWWRRITYRHTWGDKDTWLLAAVAESGEERGGCPR